MRNYFPKKVYILILVSFMVRGTTCAQPGGSIADSMNTFMIEENLNIFLGFGCNIVQKGETDYSFHFGYSTNEARHEWSDSTIFNLGSISKLFTAIAVVMIVNEGLLKLDDPVYHYFPEFLNIHGRNRKAASVTITDLLRHTSGISQSMEHLFPEKFGKEVMESEDEFYENTFNYRAFMSREDFKSRFELYSSMDKNPGKYQFSNLNYVILGYIVEEIIGLNLAELVTNKIFVPLEMDDSHYYQTPDSMLDRLAWGYYRLSDGSYLNVHTNEVESPSPTGDGGVKTSMRDMRKFMHFLIGDFRNPAYDKILPRTALLSMMSPQERGPDNNTWVGLGFHNIQPYNLVGHTGGWDGFLGILYYHLESHSCLFLITNREDNELFWFLRVFAAYAMLFREFN